MPPSSAADGVSFRVREPDTINIDVTCPGATLALGLIYLKTGDSVIAERLAVPETQFLLDFTRPDFLMLRVISRSLVLWSGIEADPAWVERQCPALVAKWRLGQTPEAEASHSAVDAELLRQSYCNVVAGAGGSG